MKARVLWKDHPDYGYYGGRGIKVCKRWRDSFEAYAEELSVGYTVRTDEEQTTTKEGKGMRKQTKKKTPSTPMQEFYRGVKYAYTRVADKLLSDATAHFQSGEDDTAQMLREMSSDYRREAANAERDRGAWEEIVKK